jgi:putative redox protein
VTDVDVLYAARDRFVISIRGHHVVVDQPQEAGGDDLGPTPTELFVASLAACVGFYAERFLRRHRVVPDGLKVKAEFETAFSPPHRVSSVELRVEVPAELSDRRRAALLALVRHCTVHNSLASPPMVRIGLDAAQPAAVAV